ncbi:SnoaL-like domain protein [Ceratobasidium sp. AG-Ba]|nr:SnoaL-like domain protein [Ceratobasidium sp. AG-Ba]
MSDFSVQNTILRLEAQLADLQQKFDVLENERTLYNLIQDYAQSHDRCFGKHGTTEDDAKWEAFFTDDGVSNLHPVVVEDGASTSAVAQSYAVVTVVPDDEAHTVTVKGQYDWKFEKVGGVWKVANITLTPFPKP